MNPTVTCRLWLRAIPFLLASMLIAQEALAATFSVVPVRIYMTPRDRAVAITLTNEGDRDVALQAEVNVWRQKPDGTDELVASEDLILSPPIVKLGPKARQVVRLARIAPPDLSQQLTYRLIVREVPEITAAKEPVIQIPIALALSLPVFITPPNARREMACEAARGVGDVIEVACANRGNAYSQIREVQLRRSEQVLGKLEGGFYLLPGARRVLTVRPSQAASAGVAELSITFDDGRSQLFPVSLP